MDVLYYLTAALPAALVGALVGAAFVLILQRRGRVELDRRLAASEALLGERSAALDRLRAATAETERQLATASAENARLAEQLAQERRQGEDKLRLLTDARERMTQEFKSLAEGVMKQHGETVTRQNKEQIDAVLLPLKESLSNFQQGLAAAHTESTRERATLGEQIRRLTEESAKMTHETHNLTRALKGKAQTQGAWGEMILSTILERSGLREGEEFVTQESHSTEDGARRRLDVVVNLPNGQRIVVDAKVSLTAFEAYVNAETDAERAAHLGAHVRSLRGHIKTLAEKEYQQLSSDGLDYVIMFVPIEGALAAALMEDPALTTFAIDCNVTIATPTTLMIALRTVANVWQVERRNRNAEAIADRAGRLYDKFAGFINDMTVLGNRLNGVQQTYGAAMGKLHTGPGNVIRQVEQLKELGARTSKSIAISAQEEEPVLEYNPGESDGP